MLPHLFLSRSGRYIRTSPLLQKALSALAVCAIYYSIFILEDLLVWPFPVQAKLKITLSYFLFSIPLVMALTLYRKLGCAIWIVLCIISGFFKYATLELGIHINRSLITALLQTTPNDVRSFLNITTWLWALVGLCIGFAGSILIWRSPQDRSWVTWLVILILVSSAAFAWVYGDKRRLHLIMPYNVMFATYDCWRDTQAILKKMGKRLDLSKQAGRFNHVPEKPLKLVVVLGESARPDHFSLNGYERKTNPLLEQIPNLVNFPQVKSCDVMTHVSVPCILTRATPRNRNLIYKETSLISVFKALGFNTVWLNGQETYWRHMPINFIRMEADTNKPYDYQLDGAMLPDLQYFVEQDEPLLIILHTNGSHYMYDQRYPPEFDRFTPSCKSRDDIPWGRWGKPLRQCHEQNLLINAYDNSILYTDWFLHEIIQQLRDENSLFLYVSDHGEMLGENGRLMHGYLDEPINWRVPMLWWASDSFIAAHGKQWSLLKQRAQDPVNHNYIFHSLLDCSGVETALIDPKWSLCRAKAQK